MGDWQEYKLEDLGLLQRGRSRHRPRYAFHLYGGQYPFIQTGEIREARKYVTKFEQTYNEAGLEQSKLWPKGALCITIAANIAELAILSFNACFPDSVLGFIPNDEFADLDFIYYTLTHFQRELKHVGEGSVQDNINLGTFQNVFFPIPPLPEQKAIASVLSSLDDKIDLLHRQNKTLEAMAETLFRQWFVEEVEGGIETTLDEFAENIRENVKVEDLGELNHYVGLEHIPRKCLALSNWGKPHELASNKSAFIEKDILFGKLRSYFHKVVFAPINGVCSTDILVIRPKKKEWFAFCLFWFFSKEVVDHSDLGSGGTKMPRTNWDVLSSYPIPKPDIETIEKFNEIVWPMISKISSNIFQIRTLEKLRDTLLPKLMSGEVRVHCLEP